MENKIKNKGYYKYLPETLSILPHWGKHNTPCGCGRDLYVVAVWDFYAEQKYSGCLLSILSILRIMTNFVLILSEIGIESIK